MGPPTRYLTLFQVLLESRELT